MVALVRRAVSIGIGAGVRRLPSLDGIGVCGIIEGSFAGGDAVSEPYTSVNNGLVRSGTGLASGL